MPSLTFAERRHALRAVALFAPLPDADIDQLARSVRLVAVRRGSRVFEEGAPADSCWVLLSGRARIVIGGANADIVVGLLRPGTLVGELALLDGSTRSASLVALEPCRFLVVSSTAFAALRQNHEFEATLVAHVVATLRDVHGLIRAMSTPSVLARLAWCLCRLARQEARPDGARVSIPRRTHQELAEMIGCSRETVSRKMDVLKRRRCVLWDRHAMELDVTRLQRHVSRTGD